VINSIFITKYYFIFNKNYSGFSIRNKLTNVYYIRRQQLQKQESIYHYILIAINIFVYLGLQVNSSKQIQQMIQRHNEFINHLQKVLLQIETKTYGICIETGKLIEKEKLLALSHGK